MRQVMSEILIVVVAVIMVGGIGMNAFATGYGSADSPSADASSVLVLRIGSVGMFFRLAHDCLVIR
ncbi:hypothetical protein JOF56_009966 [Kibdelosporangium banguiense]|uniref:Uncharacterized protein n=1 Tax=Kibdelosporangium banguiense TaxID=1365924 RepID=A0ABS4TYU2_9PSEU|nr:hypothetical protein [Kibdelosporangium banguiense]